MRKTIDTLRSQKNSELEYFDRNFREEKQSMETEIISLKNKLIEKDVALEETKEALSRSRQMNHTLKEFAERNRGEKPSIEQMAENLYEFFHRHVSDRNYMGWKDTAEESKDTFRANVTHIISHTGNAQ